MKPDTRGAVKWPRTTQTDPQKGYIDCMSITETCYTLLWPVQAAWLWSCMPWCGYSFPDYTLLHYHRMGGAPFCINLCGMPFLLDNEEAGPMYELWLYNTSQGEQAEQACTTALYAPSQIISAQLNRFLKELIWNKWKAPVCFNKPHYSCCDY